MTPIRVALLLILSHVVLLGIGIRRNFVVVDEGGHLGAGLNHWQTGTFTAYRVNPHLPRALATLPLRLVGAPSAAIAARDFPGSRPEWYYGRQLAARSGGRYFDLACLARSINAAWSLLASWLVFQWSREMYGPWAGCLSLGLWCFDPTILAFAGVVVPDVPAAAAGLAACYAFWRYLRAPSFAAAWLAGSLLGVAELTKSTWLVLFVVWPLLWAGVRLCAWRRARPVATRPRPTAGQLAVAIALGLFVLNLGYGFVGTGRRLGEYRFVSEALAGPLPPREPGDVPGPSGNRFAESWVARCPVPLPSDYLLGLDTQRADFESKMYSYLRGEWQTQGWWYYYLYAMAVKMPIGTLALTTGGAILGLVAPARLGSYLGRWCLLLPAGAVLVLVSSQTGFNHHMRYVIPAFPFLFVLAGGLTRLPFGPVTARAVPLILGTLLAWAGMATVAVSPHYMSYFNELAGGPDSGHNHLVDSNIDWGQDLFGLKDWLDSHPEARPIRVAYYNFLDPRLVGIDYSLPSDEPEPGWFALDVNFVRGAPFVAPDGTGGLRKIEPGQYAYFQEFQPTAKAGYSIFIYHVARDECNRVRSGRGLSPLLEEPPPTAGP